MVKSLSRSTRRRTLPLDGPSTTVSVGALVSGAARNRSLTNRRAMVPVPSAPVMRGDGPSNTTLICASAMRVPAVTGRCAPRSSRSLPMNVPFLLPMSSMSHVSRGLSVPFALLPLLLLRLRTRRACTADSALKGSGSSRSGRRPMRISATSSANSMLRSATGLRSPPAFPLGLAGPGTTRNRTGIGSAATLSASSALPRRSVCSILSFSAVISAVSSGTASTSSAASSRRASTPRPSRASASARTSFASG